MSFWVRVDLRARVRVCGTRVCVCLQTFLHSARVLNLFWFCLVSRTRSQLPFKGQIWAKWAAPSYRANWLNKALCLHHWPSPTGAHSVLSLTQPLHVCIHTLTLHLCRIKYTKSTRRHPTNGQFLFWHRPNVQLFVCLLNHRVKL